MRYSGTFDTPFGPATAVVDEAGELFAFDFRESFADAVEDSSRVERIERQVSEYFSGERKDFDLTLGKQGSEFQRRVWALLLQIPYGETTTYGAIARRLGCPEASRAVGRANATNPVALIVPCHRVIGTNGRLTGYAGGLDLKSKLLEFERGSLF